MKYVEVIGVAGSGKSTVSKILKDEKVLQLNMKKKIPGDIWVFVPSFFCVIIQLNVRLLCLRLSVLKHIVWIYFICRKMRKKKNKADKKTSSGVVLFDQGPIYLLAHLCVYNQVGNNDEIYRKICNEVSSSIQGIIYLDAENDVLVKRIKERKNGHCVENKMEEEIDRFISKYRFQYNRIVSLLKEKTGVKELAINTGMNDARQVIMKIVKWL